MMAGFIDVTGWTAKEVARLGHEDDDTPEEFRPRRNMRRPVQVTAGGGHPGFAVADVWAAACAAQRVNGSYVKEPVMVYDESIQSNTVIKRRNRDVMLEFKAVGQVSVDVNTRQSFEHDFDSMFKGVVCTLHWSYFLRARPGTCQ
jgi:hypothetical protein